jgi:prefoldin subunit 5
MKDIDSNLRSLEKRLQSFINNREDIRANIHNLTQRIVAREREATQAEYALEKSQRLVDESEEKGLSLSSFFFFLYICPFPP